MSLHARLAARSALLSIALLLSAAATASEAGAQGVCRCNNGCHAYPGQCVQGDSTGGCEAGYAPFCDNRGGTCPRTGWISCSGACTCVRIPGYDAGAPDVPPPLDAAPLDRPPPVDGTSPSPDVPRPVDGSIVPVDATRPPDGTSSSDVPAPPFDAPISPDGSVPPDVSVPPDGAVTPDSAVPIDGLTVLDVPAPLDAPPCECTGGVCVAGQCIRDRCSYQPELGFVCTRAGTVCRLVESEPWCVPVCLGVTCATGEFCDETTDDLCVRDTCATTRCAGSLVCVRNQCVAPADAGATADGGATPPAGVDDGGCGCRTGQSEPRAPWGLALVAGALFARRRRRARAALR